MCVWQLHKKKTKKLLAKFSMKEEAATKVLEMDISINTHVWLVWSDLCVTPTNKDLDHSTHSDTIQYNTNTYSVTSSTFAPSVSEYSWQVFIQGQPYLSELTQQGFETFTLSLASVSQHVMLATCYLLLLINLINMQITDCTLQIITVLYITSLCVCVCLVLCMEFQCVCVGEEQNICMWHKRLY